MSKIVVFKLKNCDIAPKSDNREDIDIYPYKSKNNYNNNFFQLTQVNLQLSYPFRAELKIQ